MAQATVNLWYQGMTGLTNHLITLICVSTWPYGRHDSGFKYKPRHRRMCAVFQSSGLGSYSNVDHTIRPYNRCSDNISINQKTAKYSAGIRVLWPHPQQWLCAHISNLMLITKWSTQNIYPPTYIETELGKMSIQSPIFWKREDSRNNILDKLRTNFIRQKIII